jgi:hypothetical protein
MSKPVGLDQTHRTYFWSEPAPLLVICSKCWERGWFAPSCKYCLGTRRTAIPLCELVPKAGLPEFKDGKVVDRL